VVDALGLPLIEKLESEATSSSAADSVADPLAVT
jgi:hypothetical protein